MSLWYYFTVITQITSKFHRRIALIDFFLILFSLTCLCEARVLLTNGDFEQELRYGWQQLIVRPTWYDTIDLAAKYDSDPDLEIRVKKYHYTSAKVYQTVNIPTTDLQFSIAAQLLAHEHPSTSTYYWSAAAVVLRYLDNNYNLLGETRITNKSLHCPWNNTSSIHLINVIDTNNWYTYSFNIDNELNNLPGINRGNIKKVQVALFDTTNGC